MKPDAHCVLESVARHYDSHIDVVVVVVEVDESKNESESRGRCGGGSGGGGGGGENMKSAVQVTGKPLIFCGRPSGRNRETARSGSMINGRAISRRDRLCTPFIILERPP